MVGGGDAVRGWRRLLASWWWCCAGTASWTSMRTPRRCWPICLRPPSRAYLDINPAASQRHIQALVNGLLTLTITKAGPKRTKAGPSAKPHPSRRQQMMRRISSRGHPAVEATNTVAGLLTRGNSDTSGRFAHVAGHASIRHYDAQIRDYGPFVGAGQWSVNSDSATQYRRMSEERRRK